ncbi:unnamed protein product [Phytophthora lilii]|uniref:Unnamed protein product n=1 Tax=Phytophthora lilii TaxID=2077276 RepID=A0A9W6XDE3_9STRA|nr:unnamed protein product [Phytophthora lilii]
MRHADYAIPAASPFFHSRHSPIRCKPPMAKFCAECGAQSSGGKFCSECGTRFDGAAAAPAVPAVPAVPVTAYQGAATAVASAFRSQNSPYGGSTYSHAPVTPPPPPPPVAQPYPRKSVPSAFSRSSSFNPNNSGNGVANGSFTANGNSSGSANGTPPAAIPVDPVPPAATGAEAQQYYERCVSTIRASRGGANERGVKAFKQNCRRFGLREMDVQSFYASLVAELGADGTRDFVPTLARLIEGAKNYDASVPQRVCIQCAPQLHPLQDELVQTYAQSQTDNIHEARGRLHVPFSSSLNKECCNAADIIGNFFRNDWGASADRAIPVAFLQKAHGLAVMTVLKAGFLVSGKIGTGLVVAKLPDGSWSAPSAIGTFGLSGGFELGGELVEVMIILGSEGAVKVFHKPQVNLGAGLDVAVGPYGRSAQAAAAASTSGLNANYSYSQSKGLFAGISLQGAILAARSDLNRKFYGRDLQPSELLSGFVEQPAAARPLYEAIDNAMRGIEDHKEEQQRRSSVMGPCRLSQKQVDKLTRSNSFSAIEITNDVRVLEKAGSIIEDHTKAAFTIIEKQNISPEIMTQKFLEIPDTVLSTYQKRVLFRHYNEYWKKAHGILD